MSDDGYAVKFDGKLVKRCYAVAFDYDRDEVTFNNGDAERLPKGLKEITIKLEKGGR